MRRIEFEDVESFCDLVIYKYGELLAAEVEYPVVEILANFYEAREILQCLVWNGFELNDVQIANPQYGYDKEYRITLDEDGLNCSEAWHGDLELCPAGYWYNGGDFTFIHEDCNSKILKYLDTDSKDIIEFTFDDDDPCDKCDSHCYDDDDYLSVKLNGKEIHGEEAEEVLRSALLNFCEWMDYRNELLAHLF